MGAVSDQPGVYEARREKFSSLLEDGLAVIPAGSEVNRNPDVEYPFRQESVFHYLTGFDEPDAIMLLDPGAADEQYVLFVRPRDREMEIWNGRRAGTEGATKDFGADAAYPISEFESVVRRRLVGRRTAYLPFGNPTFQSRLLGMVRSVASLGNRYGRVVPTELRDSSPLLAEMRLRKTPEEVDLLEAACAISAEAHVEAMRFTQPGRYEYQVQAALEYIFRIRGARRDGYPSIVASGSNACILHYTDNDRRIQDGDLVLIDAGAEFQHYSADITRTFPAAGRFTGPQRALYDLVLSAQHTALADAKAGSTMKGLHQTAAATLAEGLVELGLLPGPVDEAIGMHHYREYFMHGTGHWLGMDVHDAGAYALAGASRPLVPGMAFTIEPGLYVDPDRETIELSMVEYDLDEWTERRMLLGSAKAKELEQKEREAAPTVTHRVPEPFRGIGIRIEDDVLITEDGHRNLTTGVPTDPDEIETLCNEAPLLPYLEG